MTLEEFRTSLSQERPPSGLDGALEALWWDGKGQWDKAHECAQDAGSWSGDWVHAYLHRKEGDISNAGYWYARASKPAFKGSLEAEWESVAGALLAV